MRLKVARVTIEDCLWRVKNHFMLVHVAAKRVRQIREGAPSLVHSPKNEDIVIALREIAAGRVGINGIESENKGEKRRGKMGKAEKDKVHTGEAKPVASEMSMKKSGRKTAAKKQRSKRAEAKPAGIKKKYVETGNVCKVTFRLPKTAAPNASSVCIAGDFNNWNPQANPMKRQKNGDYNISLELEPGREYQFRYLIDGAVWENDWNADKYVRNPFGDGDNSVIIV